MKAAATRWRLLELQRQRRAIGAGIELLDRKREGLLRVLAERRQTALDARLRLAARLAAAVRPLDRARVLVGHASASAAALAQPAAGSIDAADEAVIGVHVTRLMPRLQPFRICYGPGGTCAALDDAARAFAALLPDLVSLAEHELASRALTAGLHRTARTLNALKAVLLPGVDADIASIASALEEEEREQALRWRRGHS